MEIYRILWAGNEPTNHSDHLHVEGSPKRSGEPPYSRIDTPAITGIIAAMNERFGKGGYFNGGEGWSDMGVYHRRYIANTTIWSQHAYSNAIDIGPYYGVEEQQPFYDFLTGANDMALTAKQEQFVRDMYDFAVHGDRWLGDERISGYAMASDGGFAGPAVDLVRVLNPAKVTDFNNRLKKLERAGTAVDIDAIVEAVIAEVIERLEG